MLFTYKNIKSTLAFGCLYLCSILFEKQAHSRTWFVSLSHGFAWEHNGTSQTLQLAPGIAKTYQASRSNQVVGEGELSFGLQEDLWHIVTAQLGFSLQNASTAPLVGNIWDDADPKFNNYSYSYKFKHKALGAKAKLLLADEVFDTFTPWLSFKFGVAFNEATTFTNSPLIYGAIMSPNFTNKSTSAFTYALGLGMQYTFDEHWQLGGGYEFSDWGKSQLGPAPGQTTGDGPTMGHFFSNALLVNMTYVH